MAKNLSAAKQGREKQLIEFQSACEDLEDELEKEPVNVRRVKTKLNLVKIAYDDVVMAQAEVVSLEKTSASDDTNRSWIRDKVRKPFTTLKDRAEDLLEVNGVVDNTENKLKVDLAKSI